MTVKVDPRRPITLPPRGTPGIRVRLILAAVALTAILAVPLAGCGSGSKTKLLPSEKRVDAMYEACRKIVITDGPEKKTLEVDSVKTMPKVEVTATLKRSNGMEKRGQWAGAVLSGALESQGVSGRFSELKVTAYDGYVGRVEYDQALRPDTILAYEQDGGPVPKEDGPVRLVVGSEDGFYWVRMITEIEVLR